MSRRCPSCHGSMVFRVPDALRLPRRRRRPHGTGRRPPVRHRNRVWICEDCPPATPPEPVPVPPPPPRPLLPRPSGIQVPYDLPVAPRDAAANPTGCRDLLEILCGKDGAR